MVLKYIHKVERNIKVKSKYHKFLYIIRKIIFICSRISHKLHSINQFFHHNVSEMQQSGGKFEVLTISHIYKHPNIMEGTFIKSICHDKKRTCGQFFTLRCELVFAPCVYYTGRRTSM